MTPKVSNIFADLSKGGENEDFLTLFENASARIERIVSHAHSSPPGFWYDQEWDEWVIVLRGSATLEIEGGERVALQEGDYLTIPRRVKHRVAETGAKTVWLAVHVK
jgi:cupin 2 domain-containing protein